ncbi:MAG: ABC transporter ATP-binding protein [Alphaproteobacteria bacterium]|nr:MAG: ABC transporter ATP-binding protein [Alphaproteobacteria bacterium]
MNEPVLALESIERRFGAGEQGVAVLRGACLAVHRGQRAALVGPSGAGKSTLLHIAGLLERPDAGRVRLLGRDTGTLGEAERTRMRRLKLGFVYQYHHLLPEFSAQENVALPIIMTGATPAKAKARALDLLDAVGLAARATHRPGQLSGGEQQRVAIARALANDPALLIADEPTGNLDPGTADRVFDMLTELARVRGLAILMATHNHDLARRMDRTWRLEQGVTV